MRLLFFDGFRPPPILRHLVSGTSFQRANLSNLVSKTISHGYRLIFYLVLKTISPSDHFYLLPNFSPFNFNNLIFNFLNFLKFFNFFSTLLGWVLKSKYWVFKIGNPKIPKVVFLPSPFFEWCFFLDPFCLTFSSQLSPHTFSPTFPKTFSCPFTHPKSP